MAIYSRAGKERQDTEIRKKCSGFLEAERLRKKESSKDNSIY